MWQFVALSVIALMATTGAMEDMDMDMDMHDVAECAGQMRHLSHVMIPAHARVYIKKMVKKEMKSCLDFKFPEVYDEICKDCMMESGLFMMIKEFIDTEDLPDKEDMEKFLEKLYRCKLDGIGIAFNETDVNMVEYKKMFNTDEWEGSSDDKMKAKEIMNNCIATSYLGKTFLEKALSVEKCFLLTTLDFCETEGRSTGLGFTLFTGLTTMKDESVCDNVQVDPKYKAIGKECLDDAVKNIGDIPDEIKNSQNKMEKGKKLMKRFFEKVVHSAVECVGVKLGVYDQSTKKFNVQAAVNIIAGLPGWDSKETKDKITGQMMKCGKEFSNNYGQLNITETMKLLWKERINYDRCFWPMYVKTCGLSDTQLTRFLVPLFDEECREAAHDAFMKTTGMYMDVNLKALIHDKLASLMTVLM